MRIFYVTAWYPTPENSEIAPFVKRDVTALSRDNDIFLAHVDRSYSGRPLRFFAADGVKAIRLSASSVVDILKLPLRLRKLARSSQILHSTGVFALPVVSLSFIPLPWVHTEHWSKYMENGLLPLLISFFEHCPDRVVTVSTFLAKKLSRYGVKHVVTVPNIVPLPESLTPLPKLKSLQLISVGALNSRKSPDIAVRALRILLDRGIDASLTWVGDGPLRGEITRLIDELDLKSRVNLVGSVRPDEVPRYLSDANMFLLPTQAETFCLGAAEALAAGRPVVLGGNGGQRDFVKPPYGILVDDSLNPDAYADAIIEQMKTSQGIPPEFFQDAIAEFSDKKFAARMNTLYGELS